MTPAARDALNTAMVRLADGDRGERGPVYRALVLPVRSFCTRMLGDVSSAEDATHQVMLKLFREAPNFRRDGDALTWALSLAYWECRSERKRRARSQERAKAWVDVASDAVEWPVPEIRLALEQALQELSEPERESLLQAFVGAPLNAAERKRKQRALTRLRAWWRQEVMGE